MGGADIVEFTYDNLDRLTLAEYSIDDSNEAFAIDDLGNRDSVIVRDGNNVNYDIDNLTNRYDSVGGNALAYDAAGNLTTDKDGYQYEYDYENRIVKITKDSNDVAEFAYDALGRRIEKKDSITSANTRRYYYNNNWQILSEYDGSTNYKKSYVYGNYIDEVLMLFVLPVNSSCKYYVHDHLYSPAALLYYSGPAVERYEYDAYGKATILDPQYAIRDTSLYGNPYYFTGRQLDFLDGGNLNIQYNHNRYYDYYTGRWLSHDPLGHVDSMSLYEYMGSAPLKLTDPYGYAGGCTCDDCDEHLYWKRCWVVKRELKWRINGGALGIATQGMGSSLVEALTKGAGGAVAVVGKAFSIISDFFPSLDHIYNLEFKASRTEHYSLAHFRCGYSCKWDWKGGSITTADVIVGTPKDSWWDLGLDSTVAFPYVKERAIEMIQSYRQDILNAFGPGRYCLTSKIRCKKGETITSSEGMRLNQLCEEFKWRTHEPTMREVLDETILMGELP